MALQQKHLRMFSRYCDYLFVTLFMQWICISWFVLYLFQALQYLLNLCSHPLLVLGEKLPESLLCHLSELFPSTSDIISELHNVHHSPKLVALQEILEECGIGVDASSSDGAVNVGQHRVLIFAQHKVILTLCLTCDVLVELKLHVLIFTIAYCAGLSGHYWKRLVSDQYEEVSLLIYFRWSSNHHLLIWMCWIVVLKFFNAIEKRDLSQLSCSLICFHFLSFPYLWHWLKLSSNDPIKKVVLHCR